MTQQRDAYPLKWPNGYKRTLAAARRNAPYKVSLETAVRELLAELRKMGARDVVISSNLRTGLVKDSEANVKDPGVAIYWLTKTGEPKAMAFDHWIRLRDNVRSACLTINSLRQIERCGSSVILDRALEGFKELPPAPDCWSVLGIDQGAPRAIVSERFRKLSQQHHPDKGGNAVTFGQITQAYHEAIGAAP